jgi:hypothetical protein
MRDGEAMPLPACSSKVLQTAVAMNIQGGKKIWITAPYVRIIIRGLQLLEDQGNNSGPILVA